MNFKLNRGIVDSTFIVLFLIIGFVPYFEAIDKIAPQFLYLSILNSLCSFYVFFSSKTFSFKKFSVTLLLFSGLIIWSFFSLFYAVNKSEVLIESSRLILYLFSFVNLFILLQRNQSLIKFVPYLISLLLLIELSLVYERFFTLYSAENFSRTNVLRAFSGNINITAFNFLLKFPFLIISLSRLKLNFIIKVLIMSFFIFCLLLLGSRGANITLILILLLIIALKLFFGKRFLPDKKIILSLLISFVIGSAINLSLFQNTGSLNVIKRTANLNNESTSERLRFYSAALESILQNPMLGVGIGNWKIHSIKYDKPYMKDYRVPYHVHNDYLEIFAEMGVLGFTFYFGIFFWTCFLIYKSIKSKEYSSSDLDYMIIATSVSIVVFFADSFLNFPFARPLMQIQNLFYVALVFAIIDNKELFKTPLNITLELTSFLNKVFFSIIIVLGLTFSTFISAKVFNSFVNQQFLIAAGSGLFTDYDKSYVESFKSDIPSITATTVPIETLKASLITNLQSKSYDDTLHYMISEGKKQNPFLPFNELTKSVLFIKQEKPDSAYIYAKQAFYEIPNHDAHFNLLMDIAEAYKDTLEVEKAIKTFKGEVRKSFYDKYLQVALNIKNNIGLTESKILEKYNSRYKDNNERLKTFNAIYKVGLKNVEDGYLESLKAEKFFRNKEFEKAAESFKKSYEFNPTEVSYYENAANAYMQMGEDEKAIRILKDVILKLNTSTGKAEYLLAIIYIGQEKNNTGCDYLYKSKQKGFSIPNIMFEKFCLK